MGKNATMLDLLIDMEIDSLIKINSEFSPTYNYISDILELSVSDGLMW